MRLLASFFYALLHSFSFVCLRPDSAGRGVRVKASGVLYVCLCVCVCFLRVAVYFQFILRIWWFWVELLVSVIVIWGIKRYRRRVV